MNDVEMLKKCGIAVCPENASEGAKKYADIVGCSNENHLMKNIVEFLEKERIWLLTELKGNYFEKIKYRTGNKWNNKK